jgi:MFS transporter, DHA1 family, multidrug resistance protein
MRQYLWDLLHFSKGVRWFVLTEMFLGIGIGLYTLLLNLHLLALGLDEGQIGAISSFGVICMGVASILCGILANRFGRKRLLVLGLVFMAAGYAVFALGTVIWVLVLAQLLQAVGLALLVTTEVQLLYSYSKSKKEETQGFSMLFAIYTLFMGIGTLAGGYLPRFLGGTSTGYQWTLLTAGGFVLAAAMARLLLLPDEPKRDGAGEGSAKVHRGLRMPGRAVWIFCGMNFLIGIAASLTEPFQNVIIKFRLGWSDESVSFLLTLNGFVLFLSSFLMPPLLERLGFRTTYRLVFAVNLFSTFILAASMSSGMFSILLLAKGGAFIMLNNMMLTHTMSVLPEEDRNSYAGLRQVIRSIGGSAAIYVAGILLSDKHYGMPFLFAALFLAAGWIYYERWVKPLLADSLADNGEGLGS